MKALTKYGLLLSLALLLLLSCSQAKEPIKEQSSPDPITDKPLHDKKILIVYLSRTNNTKAVAQIIHKEIGGDLVPIELMTAYPLDYQSVVDQVARENQGGYLPPLKTQIENIKQYDVIFVGFPTWGMQLPPPIKSFLSQNDFSGKTIVPFNTNGGYGIGSSFETLRQLCANSTVLTGYSTTDGKEKEGLFLVMKGVKEEQVKADIKKWLATIKIDN
ncbi:MULTISPECIES: flavodoxin [unclassified Sphingobacterium]|uniref:flavodoxin n=1 Tax=unclassified Sphingobacterium TaxID=2609468 RepID=UPI0019D28752|nr:flavodoxin [Sphingobacterium sp. B16(2022)]